MGKITKKKMAGKEISRDNTIKDYINDPYFVKKWEAAAAFLKKGAAGIIY
jgi:hypothetical protein